MTFRLKSKALTMEYLKVNKTYVTTAHYVFGSWVWTEGIQMVKDKCMKLYSLSSETHGINPKESRTYGVF